MVLRAGTINQAGRWKHSLLEMQAITVRDSEASRKACINHVRAAAAITLKLNQ